ncbi:endonuclease [Escherichia coli]
MYSCGYQVRKIKTEPAAWSGNTSFPALQFGHQRQCWQDGGRKNCAKDLVIARWKAICITCSRQSVKVNGDCGNFMYSQWNGGEGQYGQCAMKVDFKEKTADPPARARGAIARTYSTRATNTTLHSASKRSCSTHGTRCIRLPTGSARP